MYEFLKNGNKAIMIDENGLDHSIDLNTIDYYIAQKKYTVKVEGLESFFKEYLPNTVHCFVAPQGAASFADHTDPVDVEIKCIDGIKTLNVNGNDIVLNKGQSILIPANTIHRATNLYDSIILSIGYE